MLTMTLLGAYHQLDLVTGAKKVTNHEVPLCLFGTLFEPYLCLTLPSIYHHKHNMLEFHRVSWEHTASEKHR